MSRLKWTLGLACLACCSVPILVIASGVLGFSAAGVAAMWGYAVDLLLCLTPIAGLALGYAGYRAFRHRNRCCSAPEANCTSTSCGVVAHSGKIAKGETS